MGVACLDASLIFFSVFSFAIHPRVLFFEPFFYQKTCVRSDERPICAANLDFLLVSPRPPNVRDHSPRVCLFLNHKAGWTIRSKQQFHRRVTREREEKKGSRLWENLNMKIFTFSRKKGDSIFTEYHSWRKSWDDTTTTTLIYIIMRLLPPPSH